MKCFRRFSMLPVVVSLLVLCVGGMVSDLHAYQGKDGNPTLRQLLRGIGLTDQQKEQIEEIVQAHRHDLLSAKIAVLKAGQDLLAVMARDAFDKSAVDAACNTLSLAQRNMEGIRAQLFNEIITTVLNPDQLAAVHDKITLKDQRIQRVITRLQARMEALSP